MTDTVTAKVAQALWERYGAWPNGPLAAWLTRSDCDRLAREALAALSDFEVLMEIASALREHDAPTHNGLPDGEYDCCAVAVVKRLRGTDD